MSEIVIGGIYIHYKQKKYKVIGVARHSETLEEVVIYEALYENDLGKLWVRPKSMFLEKIHTENYVGPRFKFASSPEDDSDKLLEAAIQSNLQMGYESRIEAHENARELLSDLQKAGKELRAKSQIPS